MWICVGPRDPATKHATKPSRGYLRVVELKELLRKTVSFPGLWSRGVPSTSARRQRPVPNTTGAAPSAVASLNGTPVSTSKQAVWMVDIKRCLLEPTFATPSV